MHLSNEDLLALIENADEHIEETADPRVKHLDDCPKCRQNLNRLGSDGNWLDEFVMSVKDEDTDTIDAVNLSGASSILISLDATGQQEEGVTCDSVPLDFLESPRHPELLGRLGRYDIERMIGAGGFGIVFKAYDSELNRVVAIKALAPHLMHSGPARKRFAREAQASAAIVHDHVVAIYDVVPEPIPYFVMQYIPGNSLQERVDKEGSLPTEEVLRIATQIASGLSAAHEQGLIHRDVKPANILLEESTVERVLVSDFGLARTADDASLTRSGTITGTPHYMSPEQSCGNPVDARSDIFSLGSVIYFMCTGHSPFRAPKMMAVLNRICNVPHRPLEDANQVVPIELCRIVNQMLDKSPVNRPDSIEQVHASLSELLADFQGGKLRARRMGPEPIKPNWLLIVAGVVAFAILGWRLFADGISMNWLKPDNKSQVASGVDSSDADESREEMLDSQGELSPSGTQHRVSPYVVEQVDDPWRSELHEINHDLDQIEQGLSPKQSTD